MTAIPPDPAVPCRRTYHVMQLLGEQGYHVVCRRKDHPTWVRILAWFESKDRAESYRDIEADCAEDEDMQPDPDVLEPPPALPAPPDPLPRILHMLDRDALLAPVKIPVPAGPLPAETAEDAPPAVVEAGVDTATATAAETPATIPLAVPEETAGEIPDRKPKGWWNTEGRQHVQRCADARMTVREAAAELKCAPLYLATLVKDFGIHFHGKGRRGRKAVPTTTATPPAPPIELTSPQMLPPDAPIISKDSDAIEGIRESHGIFNKPMQRRCPACNQIFTIQKVDEIVCARCFPIVGNPPSRTVGAKGTGL